MEPERIVSATRAISASAERIFELIADPVQPAELGRQQQPRLVRSRAARPPGRRRVQDDVDQWCRAGEPRRGIHRRQPRSPGVQQNPESSRPATSGAGSSSPINADPHQRDPHLRLDGADRQQPAGEGPFDDARHAARVDGSARRARPSARHRRAYGRCYGSPTTRKRPRRHRHRRFVGHRRTVRRDTCPARLSGGAGGPQRRPPRSARRTVGPASAPAAGRPVRSNRAGGACRTGSPLSAWFRTS